MAMQRAAARSGEWAQHFSNASCYCKRANKDTLGDRVMLKINDKQRKQKN